MLSDEHPVAAAPELEAVLVGATAADAAPDAAVEARAAAAQLGFGRADDPSLVGRPLAFSTAAAFAAAFPGDDGWLARAVRDFFNAGGRRAWVVRVAVDPARPLDAHVTRALPLPADGLTAGVAIAMQVPSAGLLLLPDLEYLCLAASLPPASLPPAAPAASPQPRGFRPLADLVAPPRPAVAAPPSVAAPLRPHDVLTAVSAMLAQRRPDMLCLFALPIGADQTQSVPALVQRATAYVRGDPPPGAVRGDPPAGADLPQVQAFVPLLRDAAGDIATPSGLVAGFLAATAETDGVWRSIAGRTLPLGATPLRRIESNALDNLRQAGVATLRFAPGGTALEDDILACRDTPANASRRAAGTRRLMGWLLRNLHGFGEQLVFENVLDDGRVELILAELFATLFKRGALNGGQVSDAVTIARRAAADNAVEFDIGVNAAVALETIRLRFVDGRVTTTLRTAA
jgi:hypothetical protein